jgi:hypothetical protein
MIEHLTVISDPIIKMFKKNELRPIKESSLYHSPDVSESDENSDKRKIVTKDLEWRSSTVRLNS